MNHYEPVLRRIFAAVVPGHRVIVIPGPQPATGHSPLGFHVQFPVTDDLAEAFFDRDVDAPIWAKLSVPLRWQMISYLAGHEAMHALEITQGYELVPGNTLRGVVANILADIRGDYLPALERLSHWPVNREIAYRLLCEPAGTPADAASDPLPHHDALRLLCWGLLWMRSGRLRLADGTIVDAPTDPVYTDIWPKVTAILQQARRITWHQEADLVDHLLDLLWSWTRDEITRRDLPDADQQSQSPLVDTELPASEHSSSTSDPFYWHDPPEDEPEPDTQEKTPDDSEESGEPTTGQTDPREEFEQQLRDQLSQGHHERGCASIPSTDSRKQAAEAADTLERAIQEITDSELGPIINAAHVEAAARSQTKHHPDWARGPADSDSLDLVLTLAHLIGPLGTRLATVLRPLLEGPARRRQATRHGNRLDFTRNAARIHLQARHSAETDPPIWLNDRHHGRGRIRVRIALAVDCSSSMLDTEVPLAAACHTAAAGLLTAADELGDLVDIALAGFTSEPLPIRDFGDTVPLAESIRLLAHAQALGGSTSLAPAIAWALGQFDHPETGRPLRRVLVVLTDAQLDQTDTRDSARLVANAADTIRTLAIGLGDADQNTLREVTLRTVTVHPTATHHLPELLRQVVEDIAQ